MWRERGRDADQTGKECLAVEPVGRGISCGVAADRSAAMRVAATGEDAIDHGETQAATSVSELQPSNSASAIGALVRGGGSIDPFQLLRGENLLAIAKNKLRDASSAEEVVTSEGDRLKAVELERRILGERVLSIGALDSAGNAPCCGGIAVQGNLVSVECLGRQLFPGDLIQRASALARVKVCDVVKHRNSAGSCSLVANVGACVVLNTEAKSDVLKNEIRWRRRKFLC